MENTASPFKRELTMSDLIWHYTNTAKELGQIDMKLKMVYLATGSVRSVDYTELKDRERELEQFLISLKNDMMTFSKS